MTRLIGLRLLFAVDCPGTSRDVIERIICETEGRAEGAGLVLDDYLMAHAASAKQNPCIIRSVLVWHCRIVEFHNTKASELHVGDAPR